MRAQVAKKIAPPSTAATTMPLNANVPHRGNLLPRRLLGLLSWEKAKLVWAVINVLGSLALAWAFGLLVGLRGLRLFACCLLFACSTPLRVGLGNGQHATFILAAFAAMLLPN